MGPIRPTKPRAPLPAAQHALPHATSALDEARLLRAIQALDGTATIRAGDSPQRHRRRDVDRVFRAWAFFLEITLQLEQAPSGSEVRRELVLALEARVLSCAVRFLHGRRRRPPNGLVLDGGDGRGGIPVWTNWACPQTSAKRGNRCVARVIRAAVGCFSFQLCRDASTAMLVVRSGLYAFLFDECRALLSADDPAPQTDPVSSSPTGCDAKDLTVGVDPFDWATQSLCANLRREAPVADAFLLPVGARSLLYLLLQTRIPRNEAEEFGIRQHELTRTTSRLIMGSSPTKSSPARPKKPHRLPSMFQFETRCASRDSDLTERCPVCSPQVDAPVWQVASQHSTRRHFAVRAVVLLALVLPPASPEGKLFFREGGEDVLRLAVRSARSTDADARKAEAKAETRPQTGDHRLLCEMARAGLQLFSSNDPSSVAAANTTAPQQSPSHQRVASSKPLVPVPAPVQSPLGYKLKAISDENRRERVEQNRLAAVRQHHTQRAALRQRVSSLYANAMDTRSHLLQSLGVLSSGRLHPAAENQSIVDWLDSFLTIDKKEQLRHEQEAVRQRRLLELQYQVEERRRRERDERAVMARNDVDVVDTHAKEREEAKREQFLRLQHEMRELQHRQGDERRSDAEEGVAASKKLAGQEEARRLQAAADERRRQVRESESMAREDTYYAERILREKQQREAQAKLVDPIVEQQKRIEMRRRLDEERRRNENETETMRLEDLLARQRRFVDAEHRKRESEGERKARKQMEAEERLTRHQWKLLDEAAERRRHDEEKQRRAEERRLKRQWKEWQAAWATMYDGFGNVYYYNQQTGGTQWENPFEYWASSATTTDGAATWPGTS